MIFSLYFIIIFNDNETYLAENLKEKLGSAESVEPSFSNSATWLPFLFRVQQDGDQGAETGQSVSLKRNYSKWYLFFYFTSEQKPLQLQLKPGAVKIGLMTMPLPPVPFLMVRARQLVRSCRRWAAHREGSSTIKQKYFKMSCV